ncbi:hypothetical protein PSPO01_08011 [Paraphaeosphaeria sporulosa]
MQPCSSRLANIARRLWQRGFVSHGYLDEAENLCCGVQVQGLDGRQRAYVAGFYRTGDARVDCGLDASDMSSAGPWGLGVKQIMLAARDFLRAGKRPRTSCSCPSYAPCETQRGWGGSQAYEEKHGRIARGLVPLAPLVRFFDAGRIGVDQATQKTSLQVQKKRRNRPSKLHSPLVSMNNPIERLPAHTAPFERHASVP